MEALLSPVPTQTICEGCDTPQKVRHYLARSSGKPVPAIVVYCSDCAHEARLGLADVASLTGPFPSLGVAEAEIGRLDRIRSFIAAALGYAADGDYAGIRRCLFSALTLVEARAELIQLIDEIAAQGPSSALTNRGQLGHDEKSNLPQIAHVSNGSGVAI